jgi:hypothetical protein
MLRFSRLSGAQEKIENSMMSLSAPIADVCKTMMEGSNEREGVAGGAHEGTAEGSRTLQTAC